MIVITRKKKTFGYYIPERWVNHKKVKSDELAINPQYFATFPLLEIFQTVAHEMVHLWQFHFGFPSRTGYHNKEWARKMEEIGLMPSDTGMPGGRITGQQMNDYPLPGGRFIQVVKGLAKEERLQTLWVDKYSMPPNSKKRLKDLQEILDSVLMETIETDTQLIEPGAGPRGKTKYTCPKCETNVWGKPALSLVCGDCKLKFQIN